jgi:hypothetical protein
MVDLPVLAVHPVSSSTSGTGGPVHSRNGPYLIRSPLELSPRALGLWQGPSVHDAISDVGCER